MDTEPHFEIVTASGQGTGNVLPALASLLAAIARDDHGAVRELCRLVRAFCAEARGRGPDRDLASPLLDRLAPLMTEVAGRVVRLNEALRAARPNPPGETVTPA